jgi:hypothetical protein
METAQMVVNPTCPVRVLLGVFRLRKTRFSAEDAIVDIKGILHAI